MKTLTQAALVATFTAFAVAVSPVAFGGGPPGVQGLMSNVPFRIQVMIKADVTLRVLTGGAVVNIYHPRSDTEVNKVLPANEDRAIHPESRPFSFEFIKVPNPHANKPAAEVEFTLTYFKMSGIVPTKVERKFLYQRTTKKEKDSVTGQMTQHYDHKVWEVAGGKLHMLITTDENGKARGSLTIP